jgi:hypothetical protein
VPGTAGRVPLASQIDVVSSVSGGSVTAAYFALTGTDGLRDFEQNFLFSDVMDALITRTLANPLQLFYPRIDILDDSLDAVSASAAFPRRTVGINHTQPCALHSAAACSRDRRHRLEA